MSSTVHFVTNRKPNRSLTKYGGEFGGGTTADLRYGKASVSARGKVTVETFPEKLVVDRARGTLSERSKLGSVESMTGLREFMRTSGSDALVFVHGYNVKFEDAVRSASKLASGLAAAGTPVAPLLFSWPSDGSMLPFVAYNSDRNDAKASGPAFGKAFMKLAEFLNDATPREECGQSVHLVAHSMGNYVLRHALQTIRKLSAGNLPRVFDQVLLMAADEDDDTFEHDHKMGQLTRICSQVTVYFNRSDLALHTSDKTKGNPDRLGTDGARLPGALPARIAQVDCSEVATGAVKHSYYVDSDQVIADAGAVLRGEHHADISRRRPVEGMRVYRLR